MHERPRSRLEHARSHMAKRKRRLAPRVTRARRPLRQSRTVRQRYCSWLTGKVRSGCRGLLGERDVVSEAFELGDEASGVAFGISVGEVVAAELAVGLAGGEHVPD